MEPEWIVPLEADAVAQLRLLLNLSHEGRSGSGTGDFIHFLVDRFKGLRVEVFSREHPPPHFRVSVDGESANYRISDCAQLNGGLKRYYAEIKHWHGNQKSTLVDAWNSRRPSNCPVGPYDGP